MKIYFSPHCIEYVSVGHPESPQRIIQVVSRLQTLGYPTLEPHACTDEDILAVHSSTLLKTLEEGSYFDPDTPALPGMSTYARLAAGSAVDAMQAASETGSAFSLMRPPGHHATRGEIMGFCYLNNMAIAIARFLKDNPGTRAAVLDIDCHHGNGTQDIFLGPPDATRVLYLSLHQSPGYPGTGYTSEQNALNYPLPPGTDGTSYLTVFRQACAALADFKPDLLGISAGFDTYKDDPLCDFRLDLPDYRQMGQLLAALKLPYFLVMEGGYSSGLAACVEAFLTGLDH